jgi:hypothetical protein
VQCVDGNTSWSKSQDNQARSDPEDTTKIERCENPPFAKKAGTVALDSISLLVTSDVRRHSVAHFACR